MRELLVTDIEHRHVDRGETLSATLRVGRRRRCVWFHSTQGPLSPNADPFLPVALIPAMRRGWNVRIEGDVSRSLLEGTERVQRIMSDWYPHLERVKVTVGGATESPRSTGDATVAFFSGGVDSHYTLRKRADVLDGMVFVHGFDLPLRWQRRRARVAAAVRRLADSLDKQLIEVQTNLRAFAEPYVSWPREYFGAAMGAVALLLAPQIRQIYISSGAAGNELYPHGSHPDVDRLWTNGAFSIVHDGLEATRYDKTRDVGHWPPAFTGLRVCYHLGATGLNCGRCIKCLMTMMMLRAAGCLDRIDTFTRPLNVNALQRFSWTGDDRRHRAEKALAQLTAEDRDPELRRVLQAILASDGRPSLYERAWLLLDRARTHMDHRWGYPVRPPCS